MPAKNQSVSLDAAARAFFAAGPLAVVGASRDSRETGHAIFRKLQGAGLKVFPVNPAASEIAGVPCYPDLRSIPDKVAGVIIVTAPAVTPQVVRDCVALGIPRVWIHRAIGQGSASAEAARLCREHGIALIDGACPMMYCPPVDIFHRCLRGGLGLFGKLPTPTGMALIIALPILASLLPAPTALAAAAPGAAVPADTSRTVLAGALAPLAFLVGDWGGTGTGATGGSSGSCSFEVAIQGHALLRRNLNESPAGRHEDIMLIYETPAGIRATYADMEDHVINYTVTPTADPKGAVFLSDEVAGTPRFRLTYQLLADGSLNTIFAMAPPGSAEFKTYVEGAVSRR